MVKEKKLKNKKMKCYYCEECNMVYLDKKKACECEDWCRKHKSCNLEIIKYAVKQDAGGKIMIVLFGLIVLLFLNFNFAIAHGEDDFAKAEELIKQKISCSELDEEQLELIGDYYMEQMHPGELHEIMDERMGGEGGESLRLTHINIARAFYCGEHEAMPAGMMNVMMSRSGMMLTNREISADGVNGASLNIFNFIFIILAIIILILLILLLVKKSRKKKGGRR